MGDEHVLVGQGEDFGRDEGGEVEVPEGAVVRAGEELGVRQHLTWREGRDVHRNR